YLADGTLTTTLLVGTGTLLGTVFLPVCRVFARVLFARLSWWGVPAVVISSGEDGRAILNTLEKWPEIGLRPVAFLSDETGPEELNFALGDQDWAPYLAQTFDISHAIISVPDLSHSERAKLLAHYSKFFDHVFVAAEASGSPALWKTGQRGGGLRGHGVRYPLSNPGTQAVKRAADLIGATLALLCLVPVFAVLGLLIRLDSAGPMFYCQERLGAEGQIFTLLKFRTTATPRRGCRECSTRTPIGASDTNSTTSSTTTRA
ncbi:MAG: sugar transferase, partial [Salinibacter sp.]|uniref:sugar transferase n=1 Tax=Salinibacter sp. TaxID=2065818 RepID=UPI0035D42260